MMLNLVVVVRLLWIAGILPIVVASLPISHCRVFHDLVSTMSKRGKTPPSKSGRFTIPHKYFAHMYILGVCWTSCLLGFSWYYACRATKTGMNPEYLRCLWRAVFLLLLMDAQVIRRLYESLFIFKYGSSARMHLLSYFAGFIYYTVEPISLCGPFALEIFAYTQSSFEGIPAIEADFLDYFEPLSKLGWLQWVGAVIFTWGWIHQFQCHKILGSLRTKQSADEYIIPHGDWFEISSSAHYLAEIVMYVGILVASGGSDLTVWLILTFVVANLVFHAAETHRWYLQKFEDYPSSRPVIIPLIY